MHPRQMREIVSPVFPSFAYCMFMQLDALSNRYLACGRTLFMASAGLRSFPLPFGKVPLNDDFKLLDLGAEPLPEAGLLGRCHLVELFSRLEDESPKPGPIPGINQSVES